MADKMTISQALRRIKRLKGTMATAQEARRNAVSYKAGSAPAVSWEAATVTLKTTRAELVMLQARVAVANASTKITVGGKTGQLCMYLKALSEIKNELSWHSALGEQAKTKEYDVESEELVWVDVNGNELDEDVIYEVANKRRVRRTKKTPHVCNLTESDRLRRITELQDEFDSINTAVEDANHRTLLPEVLVHVEPAE